MADNVTLWRGFSPALTEAIYYQNLCKFMVANCTIYQPKHQLKLIVSTEIIGPKGLIRAQNSNNSEGSIFDMGNVELIVLLELYVFKNLPVSQAPVSVNTMGL